MKGALVCLAGMIAAAILAVGSASATETINYTYDELGRLVSMNTTGTVNNGLNVCTAFDPAGNRSVYSVNGSCAPVPTLTIADATGTEGPSANIVFTVTLTPAATGTVSVSYSTASGTATAGSDFTTTSGTLTFAAGETQKSVSVPLGNDTTAESAETMQMTISGATGGAIIGNATATGTILDDDSGGGGGACSAIVAQSYSASSSYSTYQYAGLSGTGAGMRDGNYVSLSSVHTTNYDADAWIKMDLGSAQTVGYLVVVPSDPSAPGISGTSYLNGTSLERSTDGTNWTVVTGSIAGTQTGNKTFIAVNATARYLRLRRANYYVSVGDFYATASTSCASSTISIASASAWEGNSISFTLTRSGTLLNTASAQYATASGTAISNTDFTATSGTVTFASNQTTATVTVPTSTDALQESNETFTVGLSNPSTGTTLGSAATGTIIDDDSAQFSISANSGNGPNGFGVIEGTAQTFTVTRSGKTTTAVSVSYATQSGTATSGSDFTPTSGTLNFAANQTTATLSVPTTDDAEYEPFSPEVYWVTLSNPSAGANISSGSGGAYLYDNDVQPATISIVGGLFWQAPSVVEGQPLSFTINRSGNTSVAVSASYSVAGAPGTVGGNFTPTTATVSFAAGVTSNTITVPTLDDGTYQGTETINVTLSNPSAGAVIDSSNYQASGTINDNDTGNTTMAIGNASAFEGGALTFTVTRTGDTSTTHSATYATAGGTAGSNSDFTPVSGTVTFAPGDLTKTITVQTIDDSAAESSEVMTVMLSNPSAGISIAVSTGTGTILDNDSGPGSIIIPTGYTASSTFCCAYSGLSGTGSGMRDGVYNTVSSIHGTSFDFPSWITMDLGSSKSVGAIVVVPAASTGSDFWDASYLNGAALKRSNDGVIWTTVSTVSGAAAGVQSQIAVNASARYLRLEMSSNFLAVGDFYAIAP